MPHAGLEGGGRAPGKGQGERQRRDSSPAWEGTHRPALRGWASALQGCKVIHACCLGHRVCHSSQQQQETRTLALSLHTPCLDPQICPEGHRSLGGGLPPPTGTLQKLHVGASQPSGAAWPATSAGGPESPSDCPVQSTWAQGLLGACPQWRLFRTRLKEQVEINAIKRETWASMGFGVSRGRCEEGGAKGLRAAGASARPCS